MGNSLSDSKDLHIPFFGKFATCDPGDTPISHHVYTCLSHMACVLACFRVVFVRIIAVYAGCVPGRPCYSTQFGALV